VAAVVAEDRYVAEDAAELIEVEYEGLESLIDPRKALEPGAPIVRPDKGSNFTWEAVERVFREAGVCPPSLGGSLL
jgi:carbon-monoxide dehydrogenase large subunit